MKDLMKAALVCAAAAAISGCGDDTDTPFSTNPGAVEEAVYGYPTAVDVFDAAGNTNGEFAGATPITLGQTYLLNIFPIGDIDHVKLDLVAGTEYEFSVNKICATCDVRIYVYDADENLIDDNDDYVDYDSRVVITPASTGTYFVRIQPYSSEGVSNFRLNVHEYVNVDGDDYSSYYDCNDADADIYPAADDVSGDGIDQDCTGTDAPVALTADSFEVDNTFAAAKTMKVSPYGDEESLYIFRALSGQDRTIHVADDEDWLKMVIPARGAFYPTYETFNGSVTMEVFGSDGSTPYAGSYVINETADPKTFYVRFTGNQGSIYIPYFEYIGLDQDGDGFFTQDWAGDRDCNDADDDINPDASEVFDNSVDEDCDGVAEETPVVT